MSHDRQDVRGEGRKASNFNEAEARKEGGGGGGGGGAGGVGVEIIRGGQTHRH